MVRLKNDSLDKAADRYGAALFADLEKKAHKVLVKVTDKLDAKRPNDEEVVQDERFAMRQAMRKIKIEDDIRAIIDHYSKAITGLKTQYYIDTMGKLRDVFDANTPAWVKMVLNYTKQELNSITQFVTGIDLMHHINHVREKTVFRLNSIIVSSYKEVPKKMQEYRRTYTDALRGALRNLIRSLRGLTSGLFTSVYEQAEGRFRAVINFK